MIYLLYAIHILISLFLIAIVLLQQGKGADLSVFGGGATQTAFGARGATTLLHKLTVSAFIGFIVTTLLIGIVQARSHNVSALSALPDQAAPALPSEDEKAPATAPAPAPAPADGVPSAGAPVDAPVGAPIDPAPGAPATAPAEAPATPPAEAPATPPPAGGGAAGSGGN
jgi:preprotein translocase subunit SecG